MYLKIPFLANSDSAEPLRRAIAFASEETGLNPFEVATALSYVLEGIADEVANGSVVTLPGFGMLAPWKTKSKKYNVPRSFPAFIASKPFRFDVMLHGAGSEAIAARIERFRRNHHPSSRKKTGQTSVRTAQEAFRERVRKQADRLQIPCR